MKEYEFHPLADDYELIEGPDFEEMCNSIRDAGLDDDGIIVLYEGKILDGRNRYRACQKVGVEPRFREYSKARDGLDPAEFVRRRNDPRRHDPLTVRKQRRKERIDRIAEGRREGKSQRTLAEEEGVSRAQVREDLAASGGQGGCPPEPQGGTVAGEDSKTYPAKPKKKPAPKKTPSQPKDALGQPIPTPQKDIFGDQILPESIAWLREAQAEAQRIVERLKRKIMHYPFVHIKEVYEHLDDAIVALQCAREALEPGVPHIVCPKCNGNGCKVCRKAGHLPKWRFEELKGQEAL